MAQKRSKISPCSAKGRLAGLRSAGRHYQRGKQKVTIAACECSQAFLSLADDRAERRTCLALRFGRDGITMVSAPGGETASVSDLVLAPCQEIFRHLESPGTRLYRAKSEIPTEFRGCQSVEDELLREGSVRHELVEAIGKTRDARSTAARAEHLAVPMDDGFPDLLREIAPLGGGEIPQEAWGALERRDESRRLRLAKAQAVRIVLNRLTPAQRAAVDLVYLHTGGDLSKDEIARRLGISIETLRDRLNGAIKKFQAAFPTYTKRRARRVDTSSDLSIGGFYRKSNAKQREPTVCSYPDTTKPWTFGESDVERNWTFKYRKASEGQTP